MSRLDEIRVRLAAATPGPWRLLKNRLVVGDEHGDDIADCRWRAVPANARLIAHAPDDLRLLLDVAEALAGVDEGLLLAAFACFRTYGDWEPANDIDRAEKAIRQALAALDEEPT